MRIQYWILLAASLAYGAVGELSYRAERTVRDHVGECIRTASAHPSWRLSLIAVVFVLSAGALALCTARWKRWTATGTAGAFLGGMVLATVWHEFRMSHGSECALTRYQLGYDPFPWLREVLLYVALAIVMALLSLPIGWIARSGWTLIRSIRSGREGSGP